MSEITGKVIPMPVEEEVKSAYLNYAMSVIVSRALPDVRDGLKPVHRRLLYAMDELGLRPNAATKKSARITGDAMGKYHPHGDLSLYDALVRMAQDFSLRYPLVRGQGNFGSVDGDPPAASRYTEAKLSKVGEEMLIDLDKETVDFVPNYDESLKEPSILPSAFPNLLVNGSSGIAVGMATNLAPHNLIEICQAIVAYIEKKDISIEEIMNYVKGPDFPTGGIIFGTKGIKEAYFTGKGKVIVRGKFQIEIVKGGKEQIVFIEIPYTVNKANLVAKIADLVRNKVIDGVGDIRDESDRDGMRIVIELKKNAIAKLVLNQLFAHTYLQSTFGITNLALVDGRPKQMSLIEMISKFVEHRFEVVTRRSRYELRKAKEREHILKGLVIALNNIDEVVRIIKSSQNTDMAKVKLGETFGLDEIQTQAIVDMRLGKLTTLETSKIESELKQIQELINYLEELLASPDKIFNVVKDETIAISEKYGDKRRTEITFDEIETIDVEDLIKREEMVILLSNKGFIKRVPVSAYRNQGRGGKGSNSTALIEDDFLQQLFIASTHDHLLFATTAGKAYWIKVHEIPEATRQARGTHVRSLLAVSPNEDISTVVDIKEFALDEYLFMGTLRGTVKKVATNEFRNAKTRGIIAINLDEGDRLVSSCITTGANEVVFITRKGKALRIAESEVRSMGRQSRGVSGIHLANDDELTAMLCVDEKESIFVLSEFGYGKRVYFNEYMAHGRGTGGQRIYDSESEKTGEIVGAISVADTDDVVVITSQGKTLKLKVNQISILGRAARGVRIVNIERPDFVIGLDRVVSDELTSFENSENAFPETEENNTSSETGSQQTLD